MMSSPSRTVRGKRTLVLTAAAVSIALPVLYVVAGGPPLVPGPFAFDPIPESVQPGVLPANAPWAIPDGFDQAIVSDETDLNIYDGVDLFPNTQDVNDMLTTNETGKFAGQFLYRPHEVRPGAPSPSRSGGAVSVVDIATGAAKILVQRDDWEALDGIEWTPWGTLLVGEEIGPALRLAPDFPDADNGLVYELFLDPNDPTTLVDLQPRPALGSMAHEGIQVDMYGNVYVIDELNGGGIYRFVPDKRGDLSAGELSVLVVSGPGKAGPAAWVPLDRDQVQINARAAAMAVPNTGYSRPEDLELIGHRLYAAITGEDAVICIDLQGPSVSYFVEAGVNVPVEGPTGWGADTGLNDPDNLASDRQGNLWIVEDNVPSDIWVASPDNDGDGSSDQVVLFASMSDPGAEGTGLYFGQDQHVLFINVQHSASGNDKTMAIFKVKGNGN